MGLEGFEVSLCESRIPSAGGRSAILSQVKNATESDCMEKTLDMKEL